MDKTDLHKYSYDYSYCIESWIKEEIYPKFWLATPKFDWSITRKASRGGYYADGPSINIAMHGAYRDYKGEIYRHFEYASFDSDKEIGGFYSKNPLHKLEAIIVHEMAHAVQFYAYRLNGTRCKPHGAMFKNFYKRLRNQFINPYLPEQGPLKQDYEDFKDRLMGKRLRKSFNKISDEEWAHLTKRAAGGK
mgnify:FL=1